jgi:hypothetical protein
MAYEKRDGDCVLFKNDNRKTEKHPSHTGELLLGGVTYQVSMWPKVDRNGKTFLAGNAKVKGEKYRMADEKVPDQDLPRDTSDFDSDPIPF